MNFTPKNADSLICKECDFTCCKKSDWDRHLSTRKHKNRTNANAIHSAPTQDFSCMRCGKNYAARNSLWYHEKKCKDVNVDGNEDKNDNTEDNDKNIQDTGASDVKLLTNMVLEVVKQNQELMNQNQELQKHVIELCKNGTNNTVNSNNVN